MKLTSTPRIARAPGGVHPGADGPCGCEGDCALSGRVRRVVGAIPRSWSRP